MLNDKAEFVINTLKNAGYKTYLVGGAVRDMLMNKEAKDTDITTSATPDEIKKIFRNYKTVDTGIKHGTVTLIYNSQPIEITTFRTESSYSDNRHPDEVIFTTDIEKDLSRRDFTINSIAYNNDGFVDLFGGRADIENKIIRCVGVPEKRFSEDALRILRALRFSSVLSFQIEEETEKAMFSCKHLLQNISEERIFEEAVKLLCGKNVKDVLLKYAEIIAVVIPEISRMIGFNQHNFHHKYDLLTHTAVVTESCPAVPHLRLAALFHDIAKPLCLSFDENGVGHFYSHCSIGADITDEILRRLKCDNNTRQTVVKLIRHHDSPIEESEKIIKRRLNSFGKDLFFDLIELKRADTLGLADEYHSRLAHFDILLEMTQNVLKQEQCFCLKNLAINGNDLIALGLEGKKIGIILNDLLDKVIDGKIENEKNILLNEAKKEL